MKEIQSYEEKNNPVTSRSQPSPNMLRNYQVQNKSNTGMWQNIAVKIKSVKNLLFKKSTQDLLAK